MAATHWPRPSRVIAVARRDLAGILQGRRGVVLGGVTALLLLPAATLRIAPPEALPELRRVAVLGQVPQAVLDAEGVFTPAGDRAHLHFSRDADGTLVVRGPEVPARIRDALDGERPALVVRRTIPNMPMPGRTALFALISASVLTGAVSESIGGERSRKTLQALLAASITRGELVLGKWLAWSAYGGLAAMLAALVAIVLGRVSPGWWLLPLPTVAAGTVAVGMYLVRHTSDVVSGAAVSLRVLPALLTVTGLTAWYFADIDPLLSAALPVGGALLAAGATWPGPLPPLVATASTLGLCAVLLWRTATDLDQPSPPAMSWVRRLREVATVTAVAALGWWLPIAAPLLWGAAGNPGLTERLPQQPGVWAAGFALLAMAAVRAGRVDDPWASLGLVRPRARTLFLAIVAGVALAWTDAVSGLVPYPDSPLLAAARGRLAAAVEPAWIGVAGWAVAVAAQEIVFRGWLLRSGGPLAATVAYAVVCTPLDPMRGLVVGGILSSLVASDPQRSVAPAAIARTVWAAMAGMAIGGSPAAALFVAVATIAILTALGSGSRRGARGHDSP